MDFELLVKIVPLLLGFVATTRLIYDWIGGRYVHLRNEYILSESSRLVVPRAATL